MRHELVLGVVVFLTTPAAQAQQGEDLREAAQNPIADLISVLFQNNTNFLLRACCFRSVQRFSRPLYLGWEQGRGPILGGCKFPQPTLDRFSQLPPGTFLSKSSPRNQRYLRPRSLGAGVSVCEVN